MEKILLRKAMLVTQNSIRLLVHPLCLLRRSQITIEQLSSVISQRARMLKLVASIALAVMVQVPVAAWAERSAQVTGRSTLVHLYDSYATRIEQRFAAEYQQAQRDGLADTPANKQQFLKALFVFSLVRDQGILGNLWELVDSYPASDRRMPSTMFKEAFSGRPIPQISQLREEGPAQVTCVGYSHGRCDRLEMEFIALLSFLGVKSEMFMCGPIHVRTEVAIGGHYLIFDNSFSRFKLRETPGARIRPAHQYSVKSSNQLALTEAARIASQRIDLISVKRVEQAVESFLSGKAPTWCNGRQASP
jgi:hypothetical protein